MTGGGSSSSSSSSSPHTNARQPFLPPLNIPSSTTHNGLPAATPKPPPQQQQQQQQQQQYYTPPLLLTVRFSTSIPDLLLDIPHPRTTTVAALKHLIRSRMEQPNSQRRLRFIHSGKILPDGAVLSAVLKALPPPPPSAAAAAASSSSSARDDAHRQDPKGKGKGRAADGPGGAGQQQRVYVNCSIGDLLTDAELDEERKKAEEPAPEPLPPRHHQQPAPPPPGSGAGPFHGPGGGSSNRHYSPGHLGDRGHGAAAAAAAAAAPRGFDRLLSTGFTGAEVNQLRLQFRSIQEARHTADTMPSPDTLRGLEDAWIDNNNDAGGAGAGGAAGHAGSGGGGGDGADGTGEDGAVAAGEEFGIAGVLDILLVGMLVGFVWPLGAVGWLVRDEEKISKRMRVFMYLGFVFSLLVGTIRAIG